MSNELEAKVEKLTDRLNALEKKLLEPVAQGIVDNMTKRFTTLAAKYDNRHVMMADNLSCYNKLDDSDTESRKFLPLGEAIKHMKKGKKVSRYSWRNPKINMYLKDNEIRVNTIAGQDCPWIPNHNELLAEDYIVI